MADGRIVEHVVTRTDTLAFLAVKYSTTAADIKRANKLFSEQSMHARRTLKIPVSAETYANLGGREAAAVEDAEKANAKRAEATGKARAGELYGGGTLDGDEAALAARAAAGAGPRSRVMRELAGAGVSADYGSASTNPSEMAAASAVARAARARPAGPSFQDEDILVVERLADKMQHMEPTATMLRTDGRIVHSGGEYSAASAGGRSSDDGGGRRRRAYGSDRDSGSEAGGHSGGGRGGGGGWGNFDDWETGDRAVHERGAARTQLPPRAPLLAGGGRGGGTSVKGAMGRLFGLGGRTDSSSSLEDASRGHVEMRRTHYRGGKKGD